MRKVFFIAIMALVCLQAQAQKEAPVEKKKDVFTIVEQMPEFPGGPAALLQYLNKHIKYPETAQEEALEGKVYVKFVVNEDGTISDAKVQKPVGNGFDEEALRVVSEMPAWKPGKQNGRAVNVYFQLPVVFKIAVEEEEKE